MIKKHPPEVFARFKQHSLRDVAISIITLYELEYGIQKSEYRQRSKNNLATFIKPLNILNLDRASVLDSAFIRAQLENKGTPIGSYDLLIAGIARSRGIISPCRLSIASILSMADFCFFSPSLAENSSMIFSLVIHPIAI